MKYKITLRRISACDFNATDDHFIKIIDGVADVSWSPSFVWFTDSDKNTVFLVTSGEVKTIERIEE